MLKSARHSSEIDVENGLMEWAMLQMMLVHDDFKNGYTAKSLEHILEAEPILKTAGAKEYFECLAQKGKALIRAKRYQEALEAFQLVRDYYAQASRSEPDNPICRNYLRASYLNLGEAHRLHDDPAIRKRALICFGRAYAISKSLWETDRENGPYQYAYGISSMKLGEFFWGYGRIERALSLFSKHHQLSHELYLKYPHDEDFKDSFATSCSKMAEVSTVMRQWPEALGYHEQQKALYEQLHEDFSENASYREKLGITHEQLAALKRRSEAEGNDIDDMGVRHADRLYNTIKNDLHYKEGRSWAIRDLGNAYRQEGQWEMAMDSYDRGASTQEELCKEFPDDPELKEGLAYFYTNIGTLYDRQKEARLALEYYNKAHGLYVQLYERMPDVKNFGDALANSHMQIGNFLYSEGKRHEACAHYSEAVKVREARSRYSRLDIDNKRSLSILYRKLGNIYQWMYSTEKKAGDLETAFRHLRSSSDILREIYERNPSVGNAAYDLAIAYYLLAKLCSDNNDPPGAISFFEQCKDLLYELGKKRPTHFTYQELLWHCLFFLSGEYGLEARKDAMLSCASEAWNIVLQWKQKDARNDFTTLVRLFRSQLQLGCAYWETGDRQKGSGLIEGMVALLQSEAHKHPPKTAEVQNYQTILYNTLDDMRKGEG